VEHDVIETSQTEHGTETPVGRAAPAAERPAGWGPTHDEEFPLEIRPTTLAELCRTAVDDVTARFPDRVVEYARDPELEGVGEWDARRVAYAMTILLEDALKRTSAEERVSLRWREHDGVVVLRVQFPRPLERGDRFVTYFEDGVRPDGADDTVGTLRIVVARKIILQHRGHLARIRTRAGTTYVATLPRSAAIDALEADAV
jgi:K+-sensing histidine kinase KdpD